MSENIFNRHAEPGIYLYLLKQTLTRLPTTPGAETLLQSLNHIDEELKVAIRAWIAEQDGKTAQGFQLYERVLGTDWPAEAETMIGWFRLENVQECCVTVLEENVPGDLVDVGVWRGGSAILMSAVLRAFRCENRNVW